MNAGVKKLLNVLPVDLIMRIKEQGRRREHRLNMTSWDPVVVGVSGPIMLFDIQEPLVTELQGVLSPYMEIENASAYDWEVVYTLGGRLSFIPWHDDGTYVRACTVYLNDFWCRDYAGGFVYENPDQDNISLVYPVFNTGVVVFPPVEHATLMPTLSAPLRESLQVFVHRKV